MSRKKRERNGTRILLSTSLLRVVVRLCACLLIVGLVGQTLIVGPIPQANANAAQLPAPVSAPPEPFLVQSSGFQVASLLELGADALFAFAAPKAKESKDR
ncbi:MAG: hypothetical protein ACKVQW_15985, partial [Pyrinomonadaceae bacterium]